jgi:hypothetical protein
VLNEYDDLLENFSEQPVDIPDVDPVAQKIVREKQEAQEFNVKTSLAEAADKNPDQHAKVLKLAGETQMTPELVEENFNEIQARLNAQKVNPRKLSQEAPSLTEWLEDPNNAAIAHDDIDTLKGIETSSRLKPREETGFIADQARAFKQGYNNLEASAYLLSAVYGKSTPREAAERVAAANKRAQEIEALAPEYYRNFRAEMDQENQDVDQSFKKFVSHKDEYKRGAVIQALKGFAKDGALTAGEALDLLKVAVTNPKGTLYSVSQNLPNSLPAIGGGIAGAQALGAAGALTGPAAPVAVPILSTVGMVAGTFAGEVPTEIGSQLNEELSKRGYDTSNPDDIERALSDAKLMAEVRGRAERKGITTAAIDSLLTIFGGKHTAAAVSSEQAARRTVFKAFTAKAKGFAKDVASEMAGETVSEFGGEVAREKGDLSKVSLGESLEEGITSLGQSVAQTTSGAILKTSKNTVKQTFSSDPVKAAEQIVTKTEDAVASHQAAESLQSTVEQAEKSKLAQRMPEKLAEVINYAHGGENPTQIFFNVDEWEKHFNEQGQSPAEAAAKLMKDDGQTYYNAQKNGDTISIPIGDFVAAMVQDKESKGLLGIARTELRPGELGMTLGEAEQHISSLPQVLEEVAQAAEKEMSATDQLKQMKSQMKEVDLQIQELQTTLTENNELDGVARTEQSQKLEQLKLQSEQLNREYQQFRAQNDPNSSAKAIEQNIKEQLSATGQFNSRDAKTNAQLFSSGVNAIAQRAGLDPARVLSAYGLHVTAEGQEQPSKRFAPDTAINDERFANPAIFANPEILGKAIESKERGRALVSQLKQQLEGINPLSLDLGEQQKAEGLRNSIDAVSEAIKNLPEEKKLQPKIISEIKTGDRTLNKFGILKQSAVEDLAVKRWEREKLAEIQAFYEDPATKQAYLDHPKSEGGKLLDTDLARELFPEYNQNRESRMALSDLLDRAAGKFIAQIYDEQVAQAPVGDIWFLGGGPGSGKSEMLQNLNHDFAKLIYDSVSGNQSIAKERIEKALAAGNTATVVYVYADIENAADWIKKRFENQETGGRPVDADYAAQAHVSALETVLSLSDAYRNNPRVLFQIVDNSADGQGKLIKVEKLREKRYIKGEESVAEASQKLLPPLQERLKDVQSQVTEAKRQAASSSQNTSADQSVREGSGNGDVQGPQNDGSQRLKQDKARGEISWGSDRQMDIKLFSSMNLSTFLHETGHFYLELMSDLSQSSPQLAEDVGIIQGWWKEKAEHILELIDGRIQNMEPGDNKNFLTRMRAEIDAKGGIEFVQSIADNWRNQESEVGKFIAEQFHEYTARGYEAYLMEGKAPSNKLKDVFQRISQWLTAIYKSIAPDVQLTDAVRSVMDRMLATERELTAAQEQVPSLFEGKSGDFLNEKDKAQWDEAYSAAQEEAREILNNKVMDELRRKTEAQYKEKRQAARERISEEVYAQNIYKAIAALQEKDGQLKIDRSSLIKDFGDGIIKRLPRGISVREGGVDHNVAAELLGYESGDALVQNLTNAPKAETLIDQRADEYMKQEYPELIDYGLSDEALTAIHNEKRAHLLRLELQLLASNNLSALKKVIKKIARRVPSEKIVRDYAAKTIGERSVKDLKPSKYSAAERKAANHAGQLLTKGEIEGSFDQKYRELLNHELYRAATDAKETVQTALKKFDRLFKSDADIGKKRDIDIVNVARAALAMHGIGKSRHNVAVYLEQIQAYDPEKHALVSALLQNVMSKPPQMYTDMKFADFDELRSAVMSIWDMSKSMREMEIAGIKRDAQEVKQELISRLSEIVIPNKRQYDGKKSNWEKAKIGLLSLKAQMRRVESWIDAIDGGDTQGVFRKYVFQPVADAANQYREEKKSVMKKYVALVEALRPSLSFKPILASELVNEKGEAYRFKDKTELIGMLLHTGNESNLRKLLLGRGWGRLNEDGSLDQSAFKNFMRRMWDEGHLTKADYDFAQGVWDLLDEMKPGAQKAHKKMYGHYFSEITANEVETPFGTYRGGYAPAVTDPEATEDARLRDDKNLFEGLQNSFMFPTTGRGFTNARVEYNAPLLMDLGLVMGHIDKVMRFTHIEPTVKSIGRMMMDKEFRSALGQLDPEVASQMLVPWLQRAASQKVIEPGRTKAGDKFFKALRKRTGLQQMVLNLANALQQFTGLSIAAVKVQPKYLRNALWTYTTNRKETIESAVEKSATLRNRVSESVMEMQGAIEEMLTNPTKYDDLKSFAEKNGYIFQQNFQSFVDVITWVGAYDQATEQGMNEKDAVVSADAALRLTQGSAFAEDVSRFETGTPFFRLFSMFYSYFNMQANLMGTEFASTVRDMGLKKGAGRLLYVYTMGYAIPVVLSELIVRAMSGRLDDDDDGEYLDDMMSTFFGSQFRALTAMVPGFGQVAQGVYNLTNDNRYDDRITTSPAITVLERAARSPKTVYEAIVKGKNQRKGIQDFFTTMGLMTGLPLAPLAKPIGYLADVKEGKAHPSGPVDYTRGLISGQPGNNK